MQNRVFIDFEFFNSQEPNVFPICAALICNSGKHKFELISDLGKNKFREFINLLPKENLTFYAYNASAEGRCFLSLGIDPLQFHWVDLMLEWKMCLNHSRKMCGGKHYAQGREITLPYYDMESQSSSLSGLASCTYKLLGKKIDTDHKTKMRDLILTKDLKRIYESLDQIMDYCLSDVGNLPAIVDEIVKFYIESRLPRAKLREEILLRGEYAIRTAKMEQLGYPVNLDWMKKLAEKIPSIIEEIQLSINSHFPETPLFSRKKDDSFKLNQKTLREWVERNEDMKIWPKTETGLPCTDMATLEKKWGKFNYTYPEGNFRAQYIRYAKALSDLKSFNPKNTSKKGSIYDAMGTDGRVRPYFNIYGAQTGRSQPPSTQYIMLKSSWLRSLVQPLPGFYLCGIDYSSQEFLLAALISGDREMLNAYCSGDVYLAFGKKIGLIPPDGTKDKFKKERNLCKAAVLGMSYSMGYLALAQKIRDDTGDKSIPDDYGLEILNQFDEAYPDFASWKKENLERYGEKGYLKAPCGWTLFGNKENFRSINNFPIQSAGASIMRKAVALAQDRGCKVILTLHDSLYIEISKDEISKIDVLNTAMKEAVIYYFFRGGDQMRTEASLWGPGLNKGEILTPGGLHVDTEEIHVEEKGVKQWNEYKHIFGIQNPD